MCRNIWPVSMAASNVDDGRCCARGCLMPLAKCSGSKKKKKGDGETGSTEGYDLEDACEQMGRREVQLYKG